MSDEADDALAAMEKARQAERVRMRAKFQYVMRTATPSLEDLHKTLLVNMTTKPQRHPLMLALTWMQADPGEWTGWHPEVCEEVAKIFRIGEDV